jgi:hypothetical protein
MLAIKGRECSVPKERRAQLLFVLALLVIAIGAWRLM